MTATIAKMARVTRNTRKRGKQVNHKEKSDSRANRKRVHKARPELFKRHRGMRTAPGRKIGNSAEPCPRRGRGRRERGTEKKDQYRAKKRGVPLAKGPKRKLERMASSNTAVRIAKRKHSKKGHAPVPEKPKKRGAKVEKRRKKRNPGGILRSRERTDGEAQKI